MRHEPNDGYWQRMTRGSLSRRRLVLGGAAALTAGGAAALAGCSSSKNQPPPATRAASIATTPVAATSAAATAASPRAAAAAAASPSAASAQVKRGGTLSAGVFTGEQGDQDPMASTNTILESRGSGIAYSQLMRKKIGPDISALDNVVEGDLAASWEQVDPMHLVFHMQPNAKWQNIAPVNGRQVTSMDVTYSYDRQRNLKFNASAIANLDAWDTPDPATLRLTLKQADADGLLTLTSVYNKVVAHDAVDVHGDLKNGPTIGSGAWIQTDWQPNQVIKFDRNPNYFRTGLPYADHLQLFRITDPATAQAAFRSKQLQILATGAAGGLTLSDIANLKKEIAGLGELDEKSFTGNLIFTKADITPTSDIRVRQAINRIVDRASMFTAISTPGFYSAGLILPTADASLSDAELKQLQGRDPAMAKQLLQAAGVNNWNDTMAYYNSPDTLVCAQIVQANFKEVNFNMTLQQIDAVRLVKYYTASDLDIVTTYRQVGNSTNQDLTSWFRSTGGDTPSHLKDPDLDNLIDAQYAEFDANKRKDLLQQIQRKIIADGAVIQLHGGTSITVNYPFFKNLWAQGYGLGTLWEVAWLDL